jgi:Chaperone of endosialidase
MYWQPHQAESKAGQGLLPRGPIEPVPALTFLTFVAMTPCRLVDTRGASSVPPFNGSHPFSGPSIASTGVAMFPVQSSSGNTEPAPCGAIPAIAEAYSFNVTVIPSSGAAANYVTLWPTGAAQPVVSTLNDSQGLTVANAAIIAGGENGSISLYSSGPATIDVVIDINGYFASPTDLNGNTAIGAGTLAVNAGTNNTATGADALQANVGGNYNTATGFDALTSNQGGSYNTATGDKALLSNSSGDNNTAIGYGAMVSNACGVSNTATGLYVMEFNSSGSYNTADGQNALYANSSGNNNTAVGYLALQLNTVSNNTATGYEALQNNTTGLFNTATGYQALKTSSTTSGSTANGYNALQFNTAASNTAVGASALQQNTTGANNTSIGYQALLANQTGANNIGIGSNAGSSGPTSSSDIIYIGSLGTAGDAAGSIVIGTQAAEPGGTIQIGSAQAAGTAIAGIYGAAPAAGLLPVCVDASGRLGTASCGIIAALTPSSLRFKEQVADMGDSSDKLLQMRPVTFLYKPGYDDGSHTLQYGLIAEEVAKLYPEMVGYDQDGQASGIKYQSLTPMLLNEVQKQADHIQSLEDRLAALEASLPTTPEPAR